MNFHSVLSAEEQPEVRTETPPMPGYFFDLNLDQVFEAVTADKEQYNLKPFFYTPLNDADTVEYRQQIAQDLEGGAVLKHVEAFAFGMAKMRRYLGLVEKLDYEHHRKGWFLEAVLAYCSTITAFEQAMRRSRLDSRGLRAFREYLQDYVRSERFTSLAADAKELKGEQAAVTYCVIVKNNTVKVRRYQGEPDYSVKVENTFERFKQGPAKDYRVKLSRSSGMNHVEAQVLDCVVKLYPDFFASLDRFCVNHSGFLDETLRRFDREVQFYVAILRHIALIRRSGLQFCYPRIAATKEGLYDREGFDLALAHKLVSEGEPVVPNDFSLDGNERIFVVSGANQGGKTTFARTFGQLHYLASLGCPVPGKQARLFLCDHIFTHFEKEEDITDLRGKLQDDLVRIRAILEQATGDSIVIVNEMFTSTTLADSAFLSREILNHIIELDALCVWVTFIDELASLDEKTVSVVATVVPDNPTERTYKIVRQPADGLAYGLSLAQKHRLTYDDLRERIRP